MRAEREATLRSAGRYTIGPKIASGGMATVHLGELRAAGGFSKTVAIKRPLPSLLEDPEVVGRLWDEARIASRIVHPNVVGVIDILEDGNDLYLVMDYVHGVPLSELLRAAKQKGGPIPPSIAVAIVADVLSGLHAAHEATGETGEPLRIVHRDVSPQNVLVGVDGVARIADFGVAHAASRAHVTRDGSVVGKMSYLSPEQARGEPLSGTSDVFSTGIVLWEALVGRALFTRPGEAATLSNVLTAPIAAPGTIVHALPERLDDVVLKSLSREPLARFSTALAFAQALVESMPAASRPAVAELVSETGKLELERRATLLKGLRGEPRHPLTSATPLRELRPTQALWTGAPSPSVAGARLRWHPVLLASALLISGVVMAGAVVRSMAAAARAGHVGSAASTTTTLPPTPILPIDAASAEVTPHEAPSSSVVVSPPSSALRKSEKASVPSKGPRPTSPKLPRCEPVTVDATGHSIFHPECM